MYAINLYVWIPVAIILLGGGCFGFFKIGQNNPNYTVKQLMLDLQTKRDEALTTAQTIEKEITSFAAKLQGK